MSDTDLLPAAHAGRGMPPAAFEAAAADAAKFITRYYAELNSDTPPPVRAAVDPFYLRPLLPPALPESPESFAAVLADVNAHIMQGITHWQHPSFMAFFPANSSYPGILGEMLSAGLNTVGFSWLASPAATELEIVVLDQLATALGLPTKFLSPQSPPADPARAGGGVIQCTASDAVLVALLAARARVRARELGPPSASPDDDSHIAALYALDARLVVYTSDQAHSAVAKAAAVAGVHRVRLLETRAEDGWTLTPATLRAALDADRAAGLVPTLVVATIGTTSTGAVDPVADLAPVATAAGAWLHVDAAWAGVAAICPARRADGSAFARAWTAGLPAADSVSTNMHKWGLTNFDCSPLWMADHAAARAALGPPAAAFAPLASPTAALDLKDLQVPLGRRMRALKLWCVLRLFGLSGLRAHIDASVALAARAAAALAADATRFRLFGEPALALVCFTLAEGAPSDALARVVDRVNASGAAFLVTSVVGGVRVGRVAVGCPDTRAAHVDGVVAALAAAVDAERGEGGW